MKIIFATALAATLVLGTTAIADPATPSYGLGGRINGEAASTRTVGTISEAAKESEGLGDLVSPFNTLGTPAQETLGTPE